MRLLMTSLPEGGGEPLETLVQTISGGGAGGLDVLWRGNCVSWERSMRDGRGW
jgi:hypothetical protein